MMLVYSTQQITMSDATENLQHLSTLQFTAAVASGFCAIISMYVLAPVTSSELHGWASVHAHTIKSYLACLYHLHCACDKMYQTLSLLIGRAWERDYISPRNVASTMQCCLTIKVKVNYLQIFISHLIPNYCMFTTSHTINFYIVLSHCVPCITFYL